MSTGIRIGRERGTCTIGVELVGGEMQFVCAANTTDRKSQKGQDGA